MEVLAGLICGLIMGLIFLGAGIAILFFNPDLAKRIAERLPSNISPNLVMLFYVIAVPQWRYGQPQFCLHPRYTFAYACHLIALYSDQEENALVATDNRYRFYRNFRLDYPTTVKMGSLKTPQSA